MDSSAAYVGSRKSVNLFIESPLEGHVLKIFRRSRVCKYSRIRLKQMTGCMKKVRSYTYVFHAGEIMLQFLMKMS